MKPKKLTTNYSFSMDNQAGELLRKLAIIHTRSNSNLIAYLLKEEGKKYGLIESRVINQIEKPVIDRKKIISLAEEAELDCVYVCWNRHRAIGAIRKVDYSIRTQ